MTSPEPERLDSRHRDTLRKIFQHPTSHNIEWREVTSLLAAIGTITPHRDGKVAVTIGTDKALLEPPTGKDIDVQTVADLRRILGSAGYRPAGH